LVEITGIRQKQCWDDKEWPPTEEVRPGLWSLPVPIPDNPLRYVLCYVLETDDGPVVVDPGWPVDASWSALEAGVRQMGCRVEETRGVLVTHFHADHYGLASRLRDASGCWIAMHDADSKLGFRLAQPESPSSERLWQIACGVPDDANLSRSQEFELMRGSTRHQPDYLLTPGQPVSVPGWNIEAVWTPGHTPGHTCYYFPDHELVLTGDHLLPRITSNVSLSWLDEGDPLGDYLASLTAVAKLGDVEALPAHEFRFRGTADRAETLREHHESRAAEVQQAIRELGTVTAWYLARHLTWSRPWGDFTTIMQRFALGETLSHLRYLEVRGLASRTAADDAGVWLWS
jgi:glyoxylase-like metal-dependent hydrolase (beta-lactamase superfamily II)